MKRGLEPELQNNEKKLKIDTSNSKKEIELNDDTEAKFEEEFKSWEKKFFHWKEQNKDHPDKVNTFHRLHNFIICLDIVLI